MNGPGIGRFGETEIYCVEYLSQTIDVYTDLGVIRTLSGDFAHKK